MTDHGQTSRSGASSLAARHGFEPSAGDYLLASEAIASANVVLRAVAWRAQTAAGAGIFCDCCGGDVVLLDADGLSSCCACSWHRGLPRFLVNFEQCERASRLEAGAVEWASNHARRQGEAVSPAEGITHVSAKPGLSSAPLGDADQVAGGVRDSSLLTPQKTACDSCAKAWGCFAYEKGKEDDCCEFVAAKPSTDLEDNHVTRLGSDVSAKRGESQILKGGVK